jgi:hypothetical protein
LSRSLTTSSFTPLPSSKGDTDTIDLEEESEWEYNP